MWYATHRTGTNHIRKGDKKLIVDKLRQYCGKGHKCKSLAELAKELGVARSTVYRWDKNPEIIPLGMIIKTVESLDLSLDQATSIFMPSLSRK